MTCVALIRGINVGKTKRLSMSDLTAPQLRVIIEENPMLTLANELVWTALRPLLEQPWSPDALAVTSRAAYLWCAAGALDSKLSQVFGRKAGNTVTLRNWATVLKIEAVMASDASFPDRA